MFKTPILFLIFNRPDTTKVVFEQIRNIKPSKLFIAADGPRECKVDERENCEQTRKLVLENIDWECQVFTLFRDKNLGCKYSVSQAITWFFDNVDQGIILEDDCLANVSFFNYCEVLLNRYKDNLQIMHIGGNCFIEENSLNNNESYYFSNYVDIWGWATWKRAWKQYDVNLKNFSYKTCKVLLDNKFKSKAESKYWLSLFESAKNNQIDTWDYQWVYTVYYNNGISITPFRNLISNIGFGPNATHTFDNNSILASYPTKEISEILHPMNITVNKDLDHALFIKYYYTHVNFITRIKIAFKKILKHKNDTRNK